MLLIGPLGTIFSEILIGIQTFSYKKMHLKMLSVKWNPFSLSLNMLTHLCLVWDIYTSLKTAVITQAMYKPTTAKSEIFGANDMTCIGLMI